MESHEPKTAPMEIVLHAAARVTDAPAERLDEALDTALMEVGQALGADRAFAFRVDLDAGVLWNSHEWCAPGIDPQIDHLQRQPVTDFDVLMRPLLEGRTLLIPDVERMPPSAALEQSILAAQGIHSLILVPFGSPLRGFVGLDRVAQPSAWSHEHERYLRILALAVAGRERDRVELLATRGRLHGLEQLLDSLPDAYYLLDPAHPKVTYVSRNYPALFGRSIEALYADPDDWLLAVHPDDRARLKANIPRRAMGPEENRYRVLLPDGSQRRIWQYATPLRDGLGNTTVIAGTTRDVTSFGPSAVAGEPEPSDAMPDLVRRLLTENSELQRVRSALESSAAIFRMLAEKTPAIVLIIQEGRVRFANPAALDLFGRSLAELGEARLAEVFSTRDASRLLMSPSETYQTEMTLIRHDGTTPRVQAVVQPVQLHADSALLVSGIDISERVAHATHTSAEMEELTRLSRGNLLSQLYAGLAHELNQPLTSIMAFGYTATRRLKSAGIDAEVVEIVQRMSSEAERAGVIVRQLRALFERRESESAPIDLATLARSTINLMALEFERQDVQLRFSAAEGIPLVLGDRAQLEVLLLNLLRNALEAQEEPPAPRWVRVLVEHVDGQVRVEVADPGRPIPVNNRSKLFESFFTTRRGGTGTGLYMARRIAERHDGSLVLVPDDQLKRFSLELPAYLPSAGAA